jgi:membrane-associated phospholipid phosphatase
VLYALAAGTPAGRDFDADVVALEWHGSARAVATSVALSVNPVTVIAGVAALTYWAARGGAGPRIATPTAIVGGTWALTHALEAILGLVDLGNWESQRAIGRAFFPSGHAAVIMALCLTLLSRRSRLACPSALAAVATALACPHFLVAWHHPSDVIGGFLVAMSWAAAVSSRLRIADPGIGARPSSTCRTVSLAAVTLAVALMWLWPGAGSSTGGGLDVLLAVAAVGIAAASVTFLFAAALAADHEPAAGRRGASGRPHWLL